VAKGRGLCQYYEVLGCSWGCFLSVVVGLKGKGGGFAVGVVLGFCGSLFPLRFPLSRCSFCILPLYLGAPHTFIF
jgi:hypothetical protein